MHGVSGLRKAGQASVGRVGRAGSQDREGRAWADSEG